MGSGSSGSSGGGTSTVNQTTTNKVELPSWAQPYAQGLLSNAGNLTSYPYSPYPYIYQGGVRGRGHRGVRLLIHSPVLTQVGVYGITPMADKSILLPS